MSSENKNFELSEDKLEVIKAIKESDNNVFITGKAGSGKTVLLKYLSENLNENVAVVAPTGVASLNAGGVTIHSMFQLPFAPYKPMFIRGVSMSRLPKYNLREDKINMLRELDTLIIDEISMVRADLMDAINDALCFYRENKEPFGGVRLIMIGDLFQLPPVVIPREWAMVSGYYSTPYFFGSKALSIDGFDTYNLTTIFRQSDDELIGLLNKIRYGNVDDEVLSKLNTMYRPDVVNDNDWIMLTATNREAERVNQKRLKSLKGKTHTFNATVSGDFNPDDSIAVKKLELKEGAQVMILVNNSEQGYVNGTIGKFVRVIDGMDSPVLEIESDGNRYFVEEHKWSKNNYVLDENTESIKTIEVGSMKQLPVKLAWGITIHKSQGLTFDKVAVDISRSFSHGQAYVALSRGRTMEGIALIKKARKHNIKCDGELLEQIHQMINK